MNDDLNRLSLSFFYLLIYKIAQLTVLRLDHQNNHLVGRRNEVTHGKTASIGITEANLSLLKRGKVTGLRFETLTAICQYQVCQPGDILVFRDA